MRSYVVRGSRRTETRAGRVTDCYPSRYAPDGSVISHLRFALRHEAFDLGLPVAALKAVGPDAIGAWARSEPTGAFSRRAWSLYETFAGRTLDVRAGAGAKYALLLNSKKHFVAMKRRSVRHKIDDDLLGVPGWCPTARQTRRLEARIALRLDEEIRSLAERFDRQVLARAASYLYSKETRSSFAIEGERSTASRLERFVSILESASRVDALSKAAFIRLNDAILDPRYAEADWRNSRAFIGDAIAAHRERVHFIFPEPQDVPDLMSSWMSMVKRLSGTDLHPVVVAAVVASSFVFIRPFEAGNGRAHRFLNHHILSKRGLTPPDMISPRSASILRERDRYERVLQSFEKPAFRLIEWDRTVDRQIVVRNDTSDLYRYFDATQCMQCAEYLFDQIEIALTQDIKAELSFVSVLDEATKSVREVVEMPDRKLSLFMRLCMQNRGRIAKRKKKLFDDLTLDEIEAMEAAVRAAMNAEQVRCRQLRTS